MQKDTPIWITISPKKTYKWPTSMRIAVQHHSHQRNANQTTRPHYFTPTIMAITKNAENSKCWWGFREAATRIHCWWECISLQQLWETVWTFLKRLNRVTIQLNNSIPRYSHKSHKNIRPHKPCEVTLWAALFITGERWKQCKCPLMDEGKKQKVPTGLRVQGSWLGNSLNSYGYKKKHTLDKLPHNSSDHTHYQTLFDLQPRLLQPRLDREPTFKHSFLISNYRP